MIEALGKHRLSVVVADIEQSVEHELADALRCYRWRARIGVVRPVRTLRRFAHEEWGPVERAARTSQTKSKSHAPTDAKWPTRTPTGGARERDASRREH